MTLEVVSFGIGGILIATAVIGGGFEIREIRIPRVGAGARLGSLVMGSVFILMGLGIWGSVQEQQRLQGQVDPASQAWREPEPDAAFDDDAPPRELRRQASVRPEPVEPVEQPAPAGITGRAHLSWNVYGAPHEAMIETSGRTGAVRVAFVGQSGAMEQVDQDLVLEEGADLLFYRGMNPRYAGTSTPHPTYSPDSFRIMEMQAGIWTITEICDNQGVCAPVRTQPM